MRLLTRGVFMNLTKNALPTHLKLVQPTAAAAVVIHNNVSLQLQQNFASEAPKTKQKLLCFPAFPLDDMIARFLKTTEPFLTKEEYQETKKVADEFIRKEGVDLQKHLEKAAKKDENWLASRWLQTAYLQYRDPVTVYSSPGHCFPLVEFKNDADYLLYVGKWIYGLAKYKEIIDRGEIPVAKMGKNELDNSQFSRVLGTCRIPIRTADKLEYNSNSKHVVVIYKNHFYQMPIFNENNKALHPEVFVQVLKSIMEKETVKGVPIGLLSTDTRDNWAEARSQLVKPEENKKNVDIIQKALFTVSLDECLPAKCGEAYEVQGLQLIHGGGFEKNSANRWMDKTIQLVINRNGLSGFTYEHSPAEGQPIALMCDYVLKNLNNDKHYECGAKDKICPKKLNWTITPCIEEWFEPAKRNITKLSCHLKMKVLHYETYGKDFIKKQKLSPDSFIQMTIQYAFYKMHHVPGAHYESAHLRIYYGGRTETIRSCSNESIAFAKAMLDKESNDEERVKLLRAAVEGHRKYTTLALQGLGVDRHLLGLKLMAQENRLPIPALYSTPGYVKSQNFRLSTSQVASPYPTFMCYGPLTKDGYACCYNPRTCDMIFAMSCWSGTETSADRFAVSMRESLDSIWELLCRVGVKTNAKL